MMISTTTYISPGMVWNEDQFFSGRNRSQAETQRRTMQVLTNADDDDDGWEDEATLNERRLLSRYGVWLLVSCASFHGQKWTFFFVFQKNQNGWGLHNRSLLNNQKKMFSPISGFHSSLTNRTDVKLFWLLGTKFLPPGWLEYTKTEPRWKSDPICHVWPHALHALPVVQRDGLSPKWQDW